MGVKAPAVRGSTKLSARQIEIVAQAYDRRRIVRAELRRLRMEHGEIRPMNSYARQWGVTKQTLLKHVRQWLIEHGQPV